MNDISGVEVVIIKGNGTERIQVEQDGLVVQSGMSYNQALNLAARLVVAHKERKTK